MIAVTPTSLTGTPVEGVGASMLCCVRLFDRRTGLGHRINGVPLQIFTRNAAEAVEDLLRNRDPNIWEARVEPIAPQPRSAAARQ